MTTADRAGLNDLHLRASHGPVGAELKDAQELCSMTFRTIKTATAALFLTAFAAQMLAPTAAATTQAPAPQATFAIEVWKSPTCGCCEKWADYLKANGFAVTSKNTSRGALNHIKAQIGIGQNLASCHTALIEGYAIEGHVPAEDIKRLLKERPDAIGLSVPNMPLGSPGMEQADGTTEPYEVLLVRQDGSVEIFAKH